MDRLEEIQQELKYLDRRLWDLGLWLTTYCVPYASDSMPNIVDRWETQGRNLIAVNKYREWKLLSEREQALEAELSEIIKEMNDEQEDSETESQEEEPERRDSPGTSGRAEEEG